MSAAPALSPYDRLFGRTLPGSAKPTPNPHRAEVLRLAAQMSQARDLTGRRLFLYETSPAVLGDSPLFDATWTTRFGPDALLPPPIPITARTAVRTRRAVGEDVVLGCVSCAVEYGQNNTHPGACVTTTLMPTLAALHPLPSTSEVT